MKLRMYMLVIGLIGTVILMVSCKERLNKSDGKSMVPAVQHKSTKAIAEYAELKAAIRGTARYAGNPVISHGKAWASRQVHFSIVMIDPADASKLIMFYGGGSCYDNDYAIGRATADVANPYVWIEYAGNPIVTKTDGLKCIVGTHAVIWNPSDKKFYMYADAFGEDISQWKYWVGLWTSTDGFKFTYQGRVLGPTSPETVVGGAGVIREDADHWYMYYCYRTAGATLPGIRCATSSDGISWTKTGTGDIVSVSASGYDDTYIEGTQAMKIGNTYVLFYSGHDASENRWTSCLAYSTSPTSGFTKDTDNPVFIAGSAGQWDSQHVSCTTVGPVNGNPKYLFYQGTNYTDNYNYALWDMGMATLALPTAEGRKTCQ